MPAKRPTSWDHVEARRLLLTGLVAGGDVFELTASVFDLHPDRNTFPGEVFMELAADALDLAQVTRENPIPYLGLSETYLPEREFQRRENSKIQYAILTAASVRGGVEPYLLDEVTRWADDYWRYALYGAVALIRASAEHAGITVARLAEELAARHGIVLA